MKNTLYFRFAGSCFLLIVMFLGYTVKFYPEWLITFDDTITAFVRKLYPAMNTYFLWVTKFANPITIALLFLAVLFIMWRGKSYAEALWLSCGVIGISGILNPLLKLIFTRNRPTLEHMVTEHSYSFPSGHSNASMVLYGTLLLVVPLFLHKKIGQKAIQLLLAVLILSIGISRIYLGVHFPSDVLGGYCVGLAWLCFSYPYYLKKRFVWRFTNKQS